MKTMKIYIINWMYGCIRMYLFPNYIENKLNKFFYWYLDTDAISDIEDWIRDYKNTFTKINQVDLPEEIREDFSFKRHKKEKYDFDNEVDIYEFQINNSMEQQSQLKVIKAGFTIIRPQNEPTPIIKAKTAKQHEWHTLEKFPSKAARDRRIKELLDEPMVIMD